MPSWYEQFKLEPGQLRLAKIVCPRSTDRVLIIRSTEKNVVGILENIVKELREHPIVDYQRTYDPKNYNPKTVGLYGGFTEKPSKDVVMTTQTISVPKSFGSTLRGEDVKAIHRCIAVSGAYVDMGEPTERDRDVVIIKGTEKQITKAIGSLKKSLILFHNKEQREAAELEN
uniref:K Homology domain-containing protein n=1 Tax=Ditylenchus dipsaci TaxID=166011 RepID=A0A915CMW9_9BILA